MAVAVHAAVLSALSTGPMVVVSVMLLHRQASVLEVAAVVSHEICLSSGDRYTGGDGVYTLTTRYERDPECLECSAAAVFEVRPDMTLQEVRPCVDIGGFGYKRSQM